MPAGQHESTIAKQVRTFLEIVAAVELAAVWLVSPVLTWNESLRTQIAIDERTGLFRYLSLVCYLLFTLEASVQRPSLEPGIDEFPAENRGRQRALRRTLRAVLKSIFLAFFVFVEWVNIQRFLGNLQASSWWLAILAGAILCARVGYIALGWKNMEPTRLGRSRR